MVSIIQCDCGSADHHGSDHERRDYYVSIIDGTGQRSILASGPFETHRAALADVERVRRAVCDRYAADPNLPWYSYGTSSVKQGERVRVAGI